MIGLTGVLHERRLSYHHTSTHNKHVVVSRKVNQENRARMSGLSRHQANRDQHILSANLIRMQAPDEK